MDDKRDEPTLWTLWRWNWLVIVLTVIILFGVQIVLLVLVGAVFG